MAGELEVQFDVVIAHGRAATRTALTKALTDAGYRVVASVDRGELLPALLMQHHPEVVVVGVELGGSLAVHDTLALVAHVLPDARRVAVGRMHPDPLADASVGASKPSEVVVAVRNLLAGPMPAPASRRPRAIAR